MGSNNQDVESNKADFVKQTEYKTIDLSNEKNKENEEEISRPWQSNNSYVQQINF